MHYEFVTANDIIELRKNRLRALELDHCAALLTLEENPKDALTRQDLAELERRIAHHRSILSPASEDSAMTANEDAKPVEDNPS